MHRPTSLRIEPLEARDVPTVFGNPWPDARGLTLSFAPDGVGFTSQVRGADGGTSNLFAELNARMGTAVWQEQVLRAVHAWTSQANLNVGLVPDDGRSFGPEGYSVASPGADFRVGAVPASGDVLAVNFPFHPLTGDRAGNVMLNADRTFTADGGNGGFELYTVMLNEFGNALGLADNDADANSALHGKYRKKITGLVASDVAAVRALYGARPSDAFEGANNNNDRTRASGLSPASDPAAAGRQRVVANGDLTTAADTDFYKFTTPAGATNFTVRLGTAGKSLLAGKVEVLNAAGTVVATKTNTSPLQGDTVLTVSGVSANTTYFVRVAAGRADTFHTGAYQLRVGFNYDPVTETKTDPTQRLGSDAGGNDTRGTATTLTTTAGFAANTHYEATARIEAVNDIDFYKVVAPTTGGAMTITTRGNGDLSAAVQVFDAAGVRVPANTLLSWEGGLFRTQVPATVGGRTYFVRAAVQDADWSAPAGDYRLDVDFRQPLAARSLVTSGTARESSVTKLKIDVKEAQVYSFGLTATSTNLAALNWLDVTILDGRGNRVALFGTDGKASVDTQTVFLDKGQYTIVIDPIHAQSGTGATAAFQLRTKLLSDPIDVYDPTDPADQPQPAPPPCDDPELVVIGTPWSEPVG